MMMNGITRSGVAAAALALATIGLAAQQAPAFKRTVLQQVELTVPGREAVMALAEFPAGSETGKHTHPGEEISFVEAGPFVLEVDGQPAKTFKTGEVFNVPAGKVHNGHPVPGGTAKIVATYVIEKGKPVSSPATGK